MVERRAVNADVAGPNPAPRDLMRGKCHASLLTRIVKVQFLPPELKGEFLFVKIGYLG